MARHTAANQELLPEIDPAFDPQPASTAWLMDAVCPLRDDVRQYLTGDCFLAPISATVTTDRSSGSVALVAGLIAAVRLARVESDELGRRSPRVRCAIADSVSIARMVIEETKARQ